MRRGVALFLALALLPGCSSMLEREYLSVTAHVNQTVLADDPSILRAENYQGLVNGLLYFVSQGLETGTIRLTKYAGDPEADLAAACAEVQEEDPLGAYALDGIEAECSLIVSYYECSLSFSYRRTPEQLSQVRTVSGSSAIRTGLAQALTAYEPEVALRISSYYGDENTLLTLLDEAYQSIGLAALGMPQVELTLYPQVTGGSQRIAELIFTYPHSLRELRRQAADNTKTAQSLSSQSYASEEEAALRFARSLHYNPEGPSSTYEALSGAGADSLGVALACQALCSGYGLPCLLVSGSREGVPHHWNLVQVDGVYRHLDASADEPALCGDNQMEGFDWDASRYPASPGNDMETLFSGMEDDAQNP